MFPLNLSELTLSPSAVLNITVFNPHPFLGSKNFVGAVGLPFEKKKTSLSIIDVMVLLLILPVSARSTATRYLSKGT